MCCPYCARRGRSNCRGRSSSGCHSAGLGTARRLCTAAAACTGGGGEMGFTGADPVSHSFGLGDIGNSMDFANDARRPRHGRGVDPLPQAALRSCHPGSCTGRRHSGMGSLVRSHPWVVWSCDPSLGEPRQCDRALVGAHVVKNRAGPASHRRRPPHRNWLRPPEYVFKVWKGREGHELALGRIAWNQCRVDIPCLRFRPQVLRAGGLPC